MESIYQDGITKYTDPFWDNICKKCGKRFWSVTLLCSCPVCGNDYLYVINKTDHTDEELEKYKHRRMMEE